MRGRLFVTSARNWHALRTFPASHYVGIVRNGADAIQIIHVDYIPPSARFPARVHSMPSPRWSNNPPRTRP